MKFSFIWFQWSTWIYIAFHIYVSLPAGITFYFFVRELGRSMFICAMTDFHMCEGQVSWVSCPTSSIHYQDLYARHKDSHCRIDDHIPSYTMFWQWHIWGIIHKMAGRRGYAWFHFRSLMMGTLKKMPWSIHGLFSIEKGIGDISLATLAYF